MSTISTPTTRSKGVSHLIAALHGRRSRAGRLVALVLLATLCPLGAWAGVLGLQDFSLFTVESYPVTAGTSTADWQQEDFADVSQLGEPERSTFLFSDTSISSAEVNGRFFVRQNDGDGTGSFGVALSFQPGITQDPNAEYLWISWARSDEGTGDVGLAVSRVFGLPSEAELRLRTDLPEDAEGGVELLARGQIRGFMPWIEATTYNLRLELTADRLRVFLNDDLEVDLDLLSLSATVPLRALEPGRLALSNRSQPGALYSTFTVVPLENPGPRLEVPAQVPVRPGAVAEVPVRLESRGNPVASTVFTLDYDESCLFLDPSDNDSDGIPDSVSFFAGNPPPGLLLVADLDAARTDGELRVVVVDIAPPITPFVDGDLLNLSFETICSAATGQPFRDATVAFAQGLAPSFGDPAGQGLAGEAVDGSVRILGGIPGDCNADGRVDAGDLVACALEIFDGDGAFFLDTPGGTFSGSPIGCDANEDDLVDAGDLSCKVLLIFGGAGACTTGPVQLGAPAFGGGGFGESAAQLPTLRPLAAEPGRGKEFLLPVQLDPAGHDLNALAFTLSYDARALNVDSRDEDGDGVLDALQLRLPAGTVASASLHRQGRRGEVRIFLLDFQGALLPLDGESLLALEMTPTGRTARTRIRLDRGTPTSFGDLDGRSIPGQTENIRLDLRR